MRTIEIPASRFEALESLLITAGIVTGAESFMLNGASFIARGMPTRIQPVAFNGRDWKVAIQQLQPTAN